MPTASISGIFSTSVYFVSMLLLLLILVNPVVSAYRGASLQAATHLAQGVATEIDDLAPGMTTTLEFDSYPGTQQVVTLSGSAVTATVNGQDATVAIGWPAANSTMVPGEVYTVYLQGGIAEVA